MSNNPGKATNKTYEFLKECGTFFVATINGNTPAVRPFGGVWECNNELYFTTSNTKEVYSQLINNSRLQITALKAGTRDWIRIDGKAVEVFDLSMKQAMLDAFPRLLKHFNSKNCGYYSLFKITEMKSLLNTNGSFSELS